MPTCLLAWNPKRWKWDDLAEDCEAVRSGRSDPIRWSCGRARWIRPGDRAFLIRLGRGRRGIFGSGTIVTGPEEDLHWDDDRASFGDTVLYVEVQLDTLLNPDVDPVLPREALNDPPFSTMHWDTQMSGIRIPDQVASELERVWRRFTADDSFSLPEEVEASATYVEGAVRQITVDAYERNPDARRECISHYGARCSICGFDFEAVYGTIGRGFIHVHHLRQLSDMREMHEVDPIRDLRPVCPNCHAMLHRRNPPYSVEELQTFIQESGS